MRGLMCEWWWHPLSTLTLTLTLTLTRCKTGTYFVPNDHLCDSAITTSAHKTYGLAMGCAASTAAQQVHGAESTSTSTARKEKLWPTTVLPVKPPRQIFDDGKTQAEHASESPVGRAVSLAWLAQFVKAHAGTTQSWEVYKEFMAEEDGGGKDAVLFVTSDNLETHRDDLRDNHVIHPYIQ